MLEDIGRLPVSLRQYVRYFMGFKEAAGLGGTVTGGANVVNFGSGVLL